MAIELPQHELLIYKDFNKLMERLDEDPDLKELLKLMLVPQVMPVFASIWLDIPYADISPNKILAAYKEIVGGLLIKNKEVEQKVKECSSKLSTFATHQ